MKLLHALAALMALALTAPALAVSGTVSVVYSLSLGPFPLGIANGESRFDDDDYSVTISGRITGIARLFSDAHADLASTGRFSGLSAIPSSFALDSWEGDFYASVRMALRGGSVTSVTIDPPADDHPGLVPITSRHRRNVLDPLSAFMTPVARGPLDPVAVCTRTVPVFDGWQRFDLHLYYKAVRNVVGGIQNYTGPVFVCGARYVPIAGHRPEDDAVQDLLENDSLEIWLAPIGGGVPYLVPYYLGLDTELGRVAIRAVRLVTAVDPGP